MLFSPNTENLQPLWIKITNKHKVRIYGLIKQKDWRCVFYWNDAKACFCGHIKAQTCRTWKLRDSNVSILLAYKALLTVKHLELFKCVKQMHYVQQYNCTYVFTFLCIFSIVFSLQAVTAAADRALVNLSFCVSICVMYHAHLLDKKLCLIWDQRWNLLLIMWYVYYVYAFSIADNFLSSQKKCFF